MRRVSLICLVALMLGITIGTSAVNRQQSASTKSIINEPGCGGDLDCYLNCRKTETDKACHGYGYKPWFKDFHDKCLDEHGMPDTDIGGDDFDCANMDPDRWAK